MATHWKTVRLIAALVIGMIALASSHSPAQPDERAPTKAELTQLPEKPVLKLAAMKPWRVVSVADGDTITLSRDEETLRVRLVGVDAPESVDPRQPAEFYGVESSRFLRNLLLEEDVFLVESTPGKRDQNGRALGDVFRAPDGLWVNPELVRQGYAKVYEGEATPSINALSKLEAKAKASERGMWNPKERRDWEAARKEPARTPAAAPTAPVVPARPTTAPLVEPQPAQPQQAAITVYVTRSGSKYHRSSCSSLSKSKIPMDLDAAKARYGPCSRCNPPG